MTKGGDLPQTLQKCGETGASLVIIDTPPSNSESLRTILGHADFVLIPTQDGITDINAIKNTVAMVREVGKPYAIVLTFINKRTTQYADATRVLSRAGATAGVVAYRAIFKRTANDGRTAQEVESGGAAAAEITDLWQYVGEEMGLIERAREEKAVV